MGVRKQEQLLNALRHSWTILREMSGKSNYAHVNSKNNFPQSAGIASSASAFAALAAAGSKAYGLDLSEKELSMLARRGSGSASRSIPEGFVEWHAGKTNADSFAEIYRTREPLGIMGLHRSDHRSAQEDRLN